ncbi:MAG: hypothetical protein RR740_00625 [Pseudomonas sp.]
MSDEKHPITHLQDVTRVLRTRQFNNLDLDQIMIAVHLLNNVLVRIDSEKAPHIKAAAIVVQFEPGQPVEVELEHQIDGMYWQRTTVINKRALEVSPVVYEYQTAATSRDKWLPASKLRSVIK